MKQKTDKKFVSNEDKFLASLRDKFAETDSQRSERIKHEKVAQRRDHAEHADDDRLWQDF